jgi:hypothetical protein
MVDRNEEVCPMVDEGLSMSMRGAASDIECPGGEIEPGRKTWPAKP